MLLRWHTVGLKPSSTTTTQRCGVLGQVKRATIGGIETSRTEYGWKASPTKKYIFTKLQQTIGYNTSDGTVSNVVDGNNRLTIFRSWMRGIPQQIEYADGNSRRA